MPSEELQALKDGLGAVKASADQSEQRNQETLEAVHDTLAEIIEKLAELENHPAQAAMAHAAAPVIDTADPSTMDIAGTQAPFGEHLAAPVAPAADDLPNMHADAAQMPPPVDAAVGQPMMGVPGLEQPAIDPAPCTPIDPALQAQMQMQPPMAPEMPLEQTVPGEQPAAEPPAGAEASREDFIAAARRAAQSAAFQSRNSGLGSFNMAPQQPGLETGEAAPAEKKSGFKFSLPFLNRKKADNEQEMPPTPGVIDAAQAEQAAEQGATNGKRRQLILAGLVLLAAVSAYSLNTFGKKFLAPKPAMEKSSSLQRTEPMSDLQKALADKKADPVQVTKAPAQDIPVVEPVPNDDLLSGTTGMVAMPTVESETKSDTDMSALAVSTPQAAPTGLVTDNVASSVLGPVAQPSASLQSAAPLGDAMATSTITPPPGTERIGTACYRPHQHRTCKQYGVLPAVDPALAASGRPPWLVTRMPSTSSRRVILKARLFLQDFRPGRRLVSQGSRSGHGPGPVPPRHPVRARPRCAERHDGSGACGMNAPPSVETSSQCTIWPSSTPTMSRTMPSSTRQPAGSRMQLTTACVTAPITSPSFMNGVSASHRT